NPDFPNVRWWKAFKEAENAFARGDREGACQGHRQLLQEERFPLRDLVILRARELCANIDDLPPAASLNANSLVWFEESFVRGRQNHFDQLSADEKIQLLWDQARLEKNDRKREAALAEALAWAEKSRQADRISEARARLWKNSPRLMPAPTAKDLPAVISDLRKNREFTRAVEMERQRLKKRPGAEERFIILKNIRQTWKVAQQKNKMIEATTELVNFARDDFKKNYRQGRKDPGTAKRLLEARTLYVRTLWTEDRRDLALKALADARRELKGVISLEEIHFLFGRMDEEIGRFPEAIAHYDNALAERPLTPGLKDRISWARAWILHKLGRTEESATAFQALADNAKEVSDKSRALFWKARNVKDANERQTLLRQVRDEDPLGYYGMMASRDLKEPLSPIQSRASTTDLSLWLSPDLSTPQVVAAEWMISLDWHEGLVRVLDNLQQEARQKNQTGTDTWLRLASAYARGGEYLPLFSLMNSLPADLRDRLLKERPELLFPRPWLGEVESAGQAAHIPPELIYAIMRQESAFNPRARSHAEAYGLMQLLPSIASSLAKENKVPMKSPEDLYEPDTAIRLGAFELRRQFNGWKGRWIPAVASYNANQAAVRGWLKSRHREDPVEFIEEIPYDETRGYVKLVMRNQVFYQRLLSALPTEFPENCLNLFQDPGQGTADAR
ncbi:MAG: transglycosylase SLT domain-containing protein, partial [Bdellovibrionaceae bacterium]|nr:transglycosylase SLT domain-containing protein [Pseudobdellovibrionaceae bacterium]